MHCASVWRISDGLVVVEAFRPIATIANSNGIVRYVIASVRSIRTKLGICLVLFVTDAGFAHELCEVAFGCCLFIFFPR